MLARLARQIYYSSLRIRFAVILGRYFDDTAVIISRNGPGEGGLCRIRHNRMLRDRLPVHERYNIRRSGVLLLISALHELVQPIVEDAGSRILAFRRPENGVVALIVRSIPLLH
ncbi:hypothetical protein D3C71_1474800 [compost metagenome]